MSIVLESPHWSTAHALDGLSTARHFRIRAEARETEWLARLDSDLNPYGHSADPELDRHFVAEDVACALGVASAVAAAKLHTATQLARRLPATLEAMREGRVDLRCATKLVELAAHLPDELLSQLETDVLADVETLTLGQFSAPVRRFVAAADPRDAEVRRLADLAERRVVFTPVEHGMTQLWALLPGDKAAALEAAVRELADRTALDPVDQRTADQRRADALCALATGGHGLRPQVNVTVAASTLLGVDEQPAELAGHGAITAAAARAIAHDPSGTWRRILTDPAGRACDITSRRYRPPAPVARLVRVRDRTCRFPTCRRAASSCELDHVRPYGDGGATAATNLIALCSRHHHLKHDGRWRVQRAPDGTVTWTSSTGRNYRTPPPDPLPHDGDRGIICA